MKIAIFSPYLDTLGGGEKYMLTIAKVLSLENQVDVLLGTHLYQLKVDKFKHDVKKLHDIDLSKVNFVKAPLWTGSSFISRFFFLRSYDFLFYLTDGSVFLSSAKNSIIHFQVPFENHAHSWWSKYKNKSWNMAIYNSNFTKEIVEKSWPFKGEVIYPPVNTRLFNPLNKKKQIISVGRFFGYSKGKKHRLMIDLFKQLIDKKLLRDWSLHLVGIAGEGDQEYLTSLRRLVRGYNIFFYPNSSFSKLEKLYGESLIYWHVAGYGEDDPKKFEHFGITTVEAMASSCVPIVINKGGQKEIVEDGVSGFLWDNLEQIKELTVKVASDLKTQKQLSKNALERSKVFDIDSFILKIKKVLEK